MLDVGDGHRLYVEESGNPAGLPLVTFHGGPGGRSKPKHRTLIDLERFRVIRFDQRCGGQSTPLAINNRAALAGYTPTALVADAETIRRHLGFDNWHVTGVSWGSALALQYAITYPTATRSLTLKALFLARQSDWAWLAEGACQLATTAYQAAAAAFPQATLTAAIADHILSSDDDAALTATELLLGMEYGLELLKSPPGDEPPPRDDRNRLNAGLLYAHVIKNHLFADGWAMTPAAQSALRDKPVTIVHGACDASCPVKNVYDLAAAHPHTEVSIAANAGHGVDLDGNYARLYRAALDRLTGRGLDAAAAPAGATPASAPPAPH